MALPWGAALQGCKETRPARADASTQRPAPRRGDELRAVAQAMLDLTAPDTRFREYESTLDAALSDLVEHTRAGREAVRARNVSDYRTWFKDADAKIEARSHQPLQKTFGGGSKDGYFVVLRLAASH